MKVNCVYGDNFYDITKEQIKIVGDGLKNNKKQIVIVPDECIVSTEKEILKGLGVEVTFDVEVLSFSRLISKILEQVKTPKMLSNLGAIMTIQMLLNEHKKELTCFYNTAKTVAFASILYDTISQIKSCNISVEDLVNCLEKIKNEDLYNKLDDIILIFDFYEKFLSQGYMDSNDRLDLSINALQNSDEFTNCDIHFCGIDCVSVKELNLIKTLLKKSNAISFGLLVPNENQCNADCYTQEFSRAILPILKGFDGEILEIQAKNSLSNFSNHILNNLMAINANKMELNEPNIKVFSASNEIAEVEWLALSIIDKVKNGARYRDNLVNCADLASYYPTIAKTFEKYNIPYFLDTNFKLSDSEGAKFLFASLDCVDENFRQKDVLRYAKNTLANFPLYDYATFENVIYEFGIEGDILKSDKKLNYQNVEFEKYLAVKSFLNPLFNLSEKISNSNTANQMVTAIREFFVETNLKENLQGMAQSFFEQSNLLKQNIARQNFDKLDNVLSQIEEILGDKKLKFNDFYRILKAGISNVNFAPLPRSIDCVFVGQSLQSNFEITPYYYILGAVEGKLPAWTADASLLTDKDIEILSQNFIKISPTVRQKNLRSKAKVLQNFICADKELFISYPVNKGKDKCDLASAGVSICQLFTFNDKPIPLINLSEMLQDDIAFGGQENRLKLLWTNKNEMLLSVVNEITNQNTKINPNYLVTAWDFLEKNGYKTVLDNIKKNIEKQTTIKNLSNPEEVFLTSDKAGVTEIEKFFNCPYAHFLNYGLKLKEKKVDKPQSLDIGNIMHAVFENFGKQLRENTYTDAEIEKIVPVIFDNVLQDKQFAHITYAGGNDTFLAGLKAEAVFSCKAINYQLKHSKYKIKFIETSFGENGFAKLPEVAIINTNKKIKIRGKIDRADIWGNRLRIIDYKTSKKSGEFSLLNFYLGKKIQLFYYLQVILNDLNLQGGGAYYLPVHREYLDENNTLYSSFKFSGVSVYTEANMFAQDDTIDFENPNSDILKFKISTAKENVSKNKIVLSDVKNSGATESEFQGMLKYAKAVLEGAINDIYAGEIRPLFVDNACQFCPYINICRKEVLDCAKERSKNFELKVNNFEEKEDKDAI